MVHDTNDADPGGDGGEGVYQEIPLYFEIYNSFLTC